MEFPFKCRKCRTQLIAAQPKYILDGHGAGSDTVQTPVVNNCETILERNELFLHEDNLPEWIAMEVEQSQWTKGKLKCTGCNSRVGSFDFVSGTRCRCAESVLPSVHLVRSKVDVPLNFNKK